MLKYQEICLYCKSYDPKKKECRGRPCGPQENPFDRKCKSFRMSDDAKFAFGEGGIGYYAETDWSRFKRDQLIKRFEKYLSEK